MKGKKTTRTYQNRTQNALGCSFCPGWVCNMDEVIDKQSHPTLFLTENVLSLPNVPLQKHLMLSLKEICALYVSVSTLLLSSRCISAPPVRGPAGQESDSKHTTQPAAESALWLCVCVFWL